MKLTNKLFKSVALMGVFSLLSTSCEDWLTIYPQDRVVEENYWEDKSDLEAVRYAAYKSMTSNIKKFLLWGDLRSDAYLMNNSEPGDRSTYQRYQKIREAAPDSSMSEFDWGGVYTTINYCNKVLSHGEEVLQKDKQFTTAEWRQMRAEMIALRALNYFYLLRSFKDIPYTTKVINKDSEIEYFGLTNQLQVLDSCIYSIEGNTTVAGSGILGQARNRFSSKGDSKGMITNTAIYAILADMYLWRASLFYGRWSDTVKSTIGDDPTQHTPKFDYEQAAKYANLSLAALERQNAEETKNFESSNTSTIETELSSALSNLGTPNCNMISNNYTTSVKNANKIEMQVFEEMFYKGNCRESILELQINPQNSNNSIHDLYTNGENTSTYSMLAACEDAIKENYEDKDYMKYDTRLWGSAYKRVSVRTNDQNGTIASKEGMMNYCYKWTNPIAILKEDLERELTVSHLAIDNSSNRNFIIYRMADVMLIRAEALACISPNSAEAKAIVTALRARAYCPYKTEVPIRPTSLNDSLYTKHYDHPSASKAEDRVMGERLIEFIGEGKRWYDLVRFAERHAREKDQKIKITNQTDSIESKIFGRPTENGAQGVFWMAEKYLKKSQSNFYTALISRMENRYGLYCPIYEYEVKAAFGNIQQNPVWNKSKYDK